MIETRRGLEAVAEIAAIPGVAGLHIGPVDLSLALDVGRDLSAPIYLDAIAAILAAGHAKGLPVTMHAVGARQAGDFVAQGFDELVLTADIEVLRRGFADLLQAGREASRS
jgi:2-keto-3-deoxy-L-rhamnonate aldolase RhmA